MSMKTILVPTENHPGMRSALDTALQLAKRPEYKGKLIVAIAPSYSERYLTSWLFEGVPMSVLSVICSASSAAAPAGWGPRRSWCPDRCSAGVV